MLVAVLGPRAPGRAPADAARPPAPPPDGERGVYRTTDGGRTWTRVLPADGSSGASDVYLDYGDPQIVYALLAAGGAPGAAPAAGPGTGVYKSIDGGATWTPVGGTRPARRRAHLGVRGRRRARTAGGSTRSRRSAAAAARRRRGRSRALSIGRRRRHVDVRHATTGQRRRKDLRRSAESRRRVSHGHGDLSIDRRRAARRRVLGRAERRRSALPLDRSDELEADARRRRSGRRRSPSTAASPGRRTTASSTASSIASPPTTTSRITCAARSRIRAPRACASRSDFGEIRPSDWYAGGGFENGFLIADPLDKRYMYTQGWYHVLRRFDRTTGQVVVLYQPTADDRFGGAPPLVFSPQDPHTLYMAAQLRAGVDRSRRRRGRRSAPTSRWPRARQRSPIAAGARQRARRRRARRADSIQAFAPSPVTAGVIWAGTSTGLIQVTRDGGKTWTNVTPPNLPPSGDQHASTRRTRTRARRTSALLSRDAHPHIYRTDRLRRRPGRRSRPDSPTARSCASSARIRSDPNLLYAGTVTSAYVSFDRGDHWQSLQLNLPTTVVSDMTVQGQRPRDLDVRPRLLDSRRRVAAAADRARRMASQAPAFFFKPEPASRARWDNTQDTPLPPEMKVGENPLEGAVFDYYLAAPATGADHARRSATRRRASIREYSSVAPPPDTTMPNVPEYWLMPPVGAADDGRHAPRRVGPALSGSADAQLRLQRQPARLSRVHAELARDSRAHAADDARRADGAAGHLHGEADRGRQELHAADHGRAGSARHRLARRRSPRSSICSSGWSRASPRPTTPSTTCSSCAPRSRPGRRAPPASPPPRRSQPPRRRSTPRSRRWPAARPASASAHRDLGRRLNDQLVADVQPTPSVIAGVDEPCAGIDTALATLRRLQTTNVAELNTLLKGAGLDALPAWTPPSAPACGR